ncbi:DMT family transporter [Thermotoga profunda]|uniref:DMT family transporter n=1 Tax=Thermotoga profunda TaxID=1508420 RepID=UPI001E359275|nr:EamA family transporter [Thermotoga profunda]
MSSLVYLYLAATLLFWSSMEVLTKPMMNQVDPFFLTFFRFLFGGIFLLIFIRKKIPFKDVILLVLIGSINGVLSMSLLQLAVKFSNASTAATLVATNPLFVTVLSLLLGKERFSTKRFLSVGVGLVGILILSYGRIEGDSIVGLLCGIGAAVTFALYAVLMRDFTLKYGSLNATAISIFSAGLIYGVLLIFTGNLKIPHIGISQWLILIYAGVFVTGLAYVTYFKAMERLGPSLTSLVFYLKPAVASFLAFWLLSEPIGLFKLLGTGIIVFALLLK